MKSHPHMPGAMLKPDAHGRRAVLWLLESSDNPGNVA
jgi:hypothetical protein